MKTDFDFSNKSAYEIRDFFSSVLNNGLHGICFSPYLEGQNIGDQLSEEQIQRRMDIVSPFSQWIRSFSCTDGNELIPKLAKTKGLKTMVGAWIDSNDKNNEKEIIALIKLVKEGLVDIAVVGNEVLLRGDLTQEELIAYINRVKQAVPGVQVGYVDAYYQFVNHGSLVDACDVILINCYPFWEGSNINYATAHLKEMYSLTKSAVNGKKIIITETGWPSLGTPLHGAVPSDENFMKYFINIQTWSKLDSIDIHYFSSFDESWKVGTEGDVGAYWGIWDKDEQLKY